jgi:hypothetical protein
MRLCVGAEFLTGVGRCVAKMSRIPLDSATSKHEYRVDLTADVELYDGQWFSVTGGHDFVDGSDWSKFFAIANFKGTFGTGPTVSTQ